MKYLHSFKRILLSLLLLTGVMGTAVPAVASSSEDGKVDVKEIVLGHMSDSYEERASHFYSASRDCERRTGRLAGVQFRTFSRK